MRRHDWDTAGIYIPRGSFWFLCFLFLSFLSLLVFFFYSNRGDMDSMSARAKRKKNVNHSLNITVSISRWFIKRNAVPVCCIWADVSVCLVSRVSVIVF